MSIKPSVLQWLFGVLAAISLDVASVVVRAPGTLGFVLLAMFVPLVVALGIVAVRQTPEQIAEGMAVPTWNARRILMLISDVLLGVAFGVNAVRGLQSPVSAAETVLRVLELIAAIWLFVYAAVLWRAPHGADAPARTVRGATPEAERRRTQHSAGSSASRKQPKKHPHKR